MGLNRYFYLGFIVCLFLVGCVGFTYHFYGLSEVIYDRGMLLGPNSKDDVPFSKCAPSADSRHPCVVMFTKDFFAFKQDYEDTQMRLKACEGK
jgi:hypothetical protein